MLLHNIFLSQLHCVQVHLLLTCIYASLSKLVVFVFYAWLFLNIPTLFLHASVYLLN